MNPNRTVSSTKILRGLAGQAKQQTSVGQSVEELLERLNAVKLLRNYLVANDPNNTVVHGVLDEVANTTRTQLFTAIDIEQQRLNFIRDSI